MNSVEFELKNFHEMSTRCRDVYVRSAHPWRRVRLVVLGSRSIQKEHSK
jgi:hypothetical protein